MFWKFGFSTTQLKAWAKGTLERLVAISPFIGPTVVLIYIVFGVPVGTTQPAFIVGLIFLATAFGLQKAKSQKLNWEKGATWAIGFSLVLAIVATVGALVNMGVVKAVFFFWTLTPFLAKLTAKHF